MNWEVGQTLKTIKKPPITREHLRAYAEASGDTNQIHLEDDFAKEAGFPSVIVHGMLSMAFMADTCLANFPVDRYRVVKIGTRFRKVTFPGDVLECGGTVKKLLPENMLCVGLWIKNQKGETTTDGEAEIQIIS
jgi:acyl dehydratase